MKYYYDSERFKSSIKLRELKDLVSIKAQPLAVEISKALFKDIYYYWTRRDTLGFVYTDFKYETKKSFGSTHKKLIGKGEKDLFKNIRDDFACLVMSRTLDKNFKTFMIGGEQGIVVSIDYFKEFLNIIRDSKNTVKLFLYKFETTQQEELIRGWLRNYKTFEEIKEEAPEDIDAIIDVLNKHKIEKPADLEKLIILAKAAGERIKSNYRFFENKLSEFKSKIDGNVDEMDVRDFMFENIWLLDFQYMSYSKKKEEAVSTGEIDISLLNDERGMSQAVVVELKKPSTPVVTTKYRGEEKPAILAEVGKAISQTIHYIEQKRGPYRTPKGIVIVGRKAGMKEKFLETFNRYLHGIEVLTYDDIYENAKGVIDFFKSMQEKQSTAIVPVPSVP
jgi:hypothetical protein